MISRTILATGIQYNYSGHDEWQQIAPGLASLEDADEIRGKALLAFERAEELAGLGQAAPEAIQQLLTLALVGAGTVGVDMASTPGEMSRIGVARDFRHIDPRATDLALLSAEQPSA